MGMGSTAGSRGHWRSANARAFTWVTVVLVSALAGGTLAAAALPAVASATPAPIALDAADNGEQPLIAYDPSTSTTYVAWKDPHVVGIDLCIVPAAAATCKGGSPVVLTDPKVGNESDALYLGGLVVLPGGEAVVIGTSNTNDSAVRPAGYTSDYGSVAWASSPGGSGFLTGNDGLENSGELISPVSLFYAIGNAVPLSSTDVALLDDYGDYVDDTSLSSPAPNIASPNSNPGEQYPRKALFTDGPEVAAEPAPPPAASDTDVLVGVGSNFDETQLTPTGCLNYAASGYGVSAGKVDGTSNATSTLNKAGLPEYGLLACAAEAPVLAQGGEDGIGLLEEEGPAVSGAGSELRLDYRPFDATSTGGTFGAPVELANVTNEVLVELNGLDLSEDAGTGVYALWENDHSQVMLDYSSNGGASWGEPVVSPAQYGGYDAIAGTGSGNAEIAYEYNPGTGEQVFLQAVNYQELLPPASKPSPEPDTLTTTQAVGATSGADISFPAGTVGETDKATLAGANVGEATGSVTYTLYSSSSCTAASALFHSTVTVSGASVPASAPVTTALSPGTYYWQASYSGDANNQASTSTCGSEVLTVSAPVATGGSGTSSGGKLTITVSCASAEPCDVTVTVEGVEITIVVKKASVASKRIVHRRVITLASGKFKIPANSKRKLVLTLTKAGKHLLAREHGHLKATVRITDKTAALDVLTKQTITIKTVLPKHKSK